MTPAEFRAARHKLGLTQAEVARRFGSCLRIVKAWEGETSRITGPTALLMEWWSTGEMPESLVIEKTAVEWDAEKRVLSYGDDHVHFSINEAGLFDILWRANQQLVSHDRIERHVWGLLDVNAKNGLGVLKSTVANKIPENFPVEIHNIPNWQGEGGGYWLER